MRLNVRHSTVYEFDAPMRFVTQCHRLTPSDSASQRVIEWDIAAEGAEFGADFVDGSGNHISTMTVEGPVERIEIVVTGVVETNDTSGILKNHREITSPRVFLQPTSLTQSSRQFEDLLEDAVADISGSDHLARAHAIAAAVTASIKYTPGATDAQSTASEALEKGEGVCQDHAHAMIVMAHLAGMPARYVTGYLLSGADGAPEEASHGWAELFIDGLGWIGFDPANECCPDDRYIRLSSGRDSIEAAPIRGVSRGGGGEAMDVSVMVSAQQ
ncbi:transglutaminase family protein [Amaricoccus tamworthensis]|uniref:transglutaminase family protein n=1 Tax=Amaricoccus tamworthensis TaxID=57002 RepID=UPI003C7BBECE